MPADKVIVQYFPNFSKHCRYCTSLVSLQVVTFNSGVNTKTAPGALLSLTSVFDVSRYKTELLHGVTYYWRATLARTQPHAVGCVMVGELGVVGGLWAVLINHTVNERGSRGAVMHESENVIIPSNFCARAACANGLIWVDMSECSRRRAVSSSTNPSSISDGACARQLSVSERYHLYLVCVPIFSSGFLWGVQNVLSFVDFRMKNQIPCLQRNRCQV